MASAVEATPDSTVREIFETNTFGVFATCRAIIPQMRKQGQGVIINVTSSAGIAPMPLVAVYAASKCAVEGFTESLSYELDQFAIKARLVEPGYAPTTNFTANGGPRMQGLIPADYGSFAQSYFEKMANYPTPYCTEAEVAEAVFAAATERGKQDPLSSRTPTPNSSRNCAGRPRKATIWRRCGRCSARARLPSRVDQKLSPRPSAGSRCRFRSGHIAGARDLPRSSA